MPVAASVALVAVVVGFTVWAGATHSEQVLPRRDAASNLQAAVSLATTGSRVVAVDPESIGGSGVLDLPGVTLASPAFFEVGLERVARRCSRSSSSGRRWSTPSAGGPGEPAVALVLPALAMGLALLALGLLVARVVGAVGGGRDGGRHRHPLPGAAHRAGDVLRAAGDADPDGRAARGDARRRAGGAGVGMPPGRRRTSGFVGDASSQGMVVGRAPLRSLVLRDASARAGLLAGLLVGGTGLVRVDALREVVLLLPVVALGAAFGARWPRPVLLGLGVSLLVAAVAAVGLSWQYLASIAGSLVPLLALGVLIGGGSWVALVLWRRGWRLPSFVVRWLPDVAAALVVVAGLYLASRPLWQTVRQDPNDPGLAVRRGDAGAPGAAGRRRPHLRGADGRVAVLVRRAGGAGRGPGGAGPARAAGGAGGGSRRVDAWLPALLVASGSTLLTLARPGITPDHPWADRRLLVALPLVVALVVTRAGVARAAVAGRGAGVGGCRGGGRRRRPRRGAGRGGDLAAPGAVASSAGPSPPSTRCAARWPPADVALAVDSRAANEWPQVVRGMCGVPVLSTTSGLRSDPAELASTVAAVREQLAGSRAAPGAPVGRLAGGPSPGSVSTPASSPTRRCARTSTSWSSGPRTPTRSPSGSGSPPPRGRPPPATHPPPAP